MPKKPWNEFVVQYPTSPAFVAAVSPSLPDGPHFDNAQRKLPTPYTLLQEWLKMNLVGDWCSQYAKGLLAVRIASTTDAVMLTNRFPTKGASKQTPVAASTTPISYGDSDYKKLATELGYSLT
jgi:hypothetical protein